MARPDAMIGIGADGSAFNAAMQQMAKNTEVMANSITARLARVGQALSGLKQVGGTVVGAVKMVTGPAAAVEDAATRLGVVMRGNAEEANKLAGALKLVEANGVVAFQTLERASVVMSHMYGSAASVESWVKVFADIEAGSGVAASRLAEMVARLKDSGKVELNELANKGIPIYEALGRVTGKNAEELRRMAADGGLATGELLEAFALLTKKGEAFHDMNAKMSNTTSGSWATLAASISLCLAELGKPINDAIRPVLQEMSGVLQEMLPRVSRMGQQFGPIFKAMANAVLPVVEALGWVLEKMTEGGRAVGYASAALLLYVGHANMAAASTVTFGASMGRFIAGVRGFSLAGVFRGFKGTLVAMGTQLKAVAVSMSVTWKGMCVGMASAIKAACTAIKAAMVSTLFGVVLVVMGEVLAKCYEFFAGVDEESQRMKNNAEDYAATMKNLETQKNGQIFAQEDIDRVLDSAKDKLEDLRKLRAEAIREGNDEELKQLRQQTAALEKWMRTAKAEMERKLQENKLMEKRQKLMEAEAKLFEEEQRAMEQRRKEMSDMQRQAWERRQEAKLDEVRERWGAAAVLKIRLKRVGAADASEIEDEMSRLQGLSDPTHADNERMKQLADALVKVREEEKRIEEARKASAEAEAERRRNYADRRRTFNEAREGERYDALDMRGQERALVAAAKRAGYAGELNIEGLRKRLDELAKAGAMSHDNEIAALERVLDLYVELEKRKKKFAQIKDANAKELRIRMMEAAGDEVGAAKLRLKVEKEKRIGELMGQGYTKKEATRQAGLEAKLTEAEQLRERMKNGKSISFVQSSLASVGGGVSRRLGNVQLAEAKKQSKLLKGILDKITPEAILA